MGGEGGMESGLVQRAGIPFETIPAAGLHGVGLRALPGNLVRLIKGWLASQRILRKFRPTAVFFTGGYVAVPMALAARIQPSSRRPFSLVFIPDIEPGLALQTILRFANRVAVPVDKSLEYIPRGADSHVSGYPIRRELKQWTRPQALAALYLDRSLKTVLVTGGSKGARSINRAVTGVLDKLLPEMQVIHVSGELDWPEIEQVKASLPQPLSSRYLAFPYLHAEMGAALAAADLVISRAGASTLGEYPYFGLPAVLVPYPHAWRYQRLNAGYLEERGAAVMVPDQDLSERLFPTVHELMSSPDILEKMKANMLALAHPRAEYEIASQIPGFEQVRASR